MDKTSLILKYFQKSDQLTTKKQDYCRTISSLFEWMVQNDGAQSDLTTKLLHLPSQNQAKIISRQEIILAGSEEIAYLLGNYTSLSFTPHAIDGKMMKTGQIVAEIEGKSREILGFERTILNIIQRMSGIATKTHQLVNIMNQGLATDDPRLLITATRKTPWTSLDKKAVSVAGGLTHRLSLADGILIKDNHLALIKKEFGFDTYEESLIKALEIILMKQKGQKDTSGSVYDGLVEIEVENQNQTVAAIKTFRKLNKNNYLAIMFDNLSPSYVKTTLSNMSRLFDLSSIIFEASGGINGKNISKWVKTGVDLISIGALTHSAYAADLSLELLT